MTEQVADDSVVVIKFEPMKPGNSVEDKTRTTLYKQQRTMLQWLYNTQKVYTDAKG